MKKLKDTEKFKKIRLIRIVTVELIIMTVSVCVSIMPQPYNIIVPIIIGARSILLKARLYAKSSLAEGTKKFKKLRLIRIVTVELIIMTVSVCVGIMPQPYNIIVPIIIGARSILLKARLYAKNPPAPDVSQYCEPTETKPSKEKKTYVESKEKDGGKAVKKATRKDNRKAVQKDGWGKYIKESSEWSDN